MCRLCQICDMSVNCCKNWTTNWPSGTVRKEQKGQRRKEECSKKIEGPGGGTDAFLDQHLYSSQQHVMSLITRSCLAHVSTKGSIAWIITLDFDITIRCTSLCFSALFVKQFEPFVVSLNNVIFYLVL